MEMTEMTTWLLQQAPVITVLGVVVYWLATRLSKAQDEKDTLSRDVIKLTTLWESKADKMDEEDKATKQQILTLLTEIKQIIISKK